MKYKKYLLPTILFTLPLGTLWLALYFMIVAVKQTNQENEE